LTALWLPAGLAIQLLASSPLHLPRAEAPACVYAPADRTVRVAVGAGRASILRVADPAFVIGGKELRASEGRVALLLSAPITGGMRHRYRATWEQGSAQWTVEAAPSGGVLRLRIHEATAPVARIGAGSVEAAGQWFRIGYTRNAEPYGQPFWPRVARLKDQRLYLAAGWKMAASNGSAWDAPDQRFSGTGTFDAGMQVFYSPRADGSRQPLDETLEVRAVAGLWQAAPAAETEPSEYGRDLASMLYLDVWDGTAADTEYLLRRLALLTGGATRFLTLFENWQAGGFDSLLPDSLRMPDYPPNPGIGSVAEFARLSRVARAMGRFGLRTNYVYLRPGSPSVREGKARQATGSDGKPAWYTRPGDWLPLARRQEAEIQALFRCNASFTDQITSAAAPWGYADYDPAQPAFASMRSVLARQRELCRLIKATHKGPLGSETNIDEQLLGRYVDTGDFGIYDGHHRLMTPEFKLRRIHGLSTFHGMGLMYRFFEMPPFAGWSAGKATYLTDPAQYDDYRACEALYGNGAYLFYYPGMPWDFVLTECLVMGRLQRLTAMQPVRDVRYWSAGRWQNLEELVDAGVDPLPLFWNPQPKAFERIRVRYTNGLTVLVNRGAEACTASTPDGAVTLGRSAWAAWKADGSFTAYSACPPGSTTRIDFVRDRAASLKYVNPRGATVLGCSRPTAWVGGRKRVEMDPRTGDAVVEGKAHPWRPPSSVKRTTVDFRFDTSLRGWTGLSDLGPMRLQGGRMVADVTGPDPYMSAPPLDLAPDSVKALVIRMHSTCGEFGQLYFRAEGVQAGAEEMCIRFPVEAGAPMRDIRIPVGDHPLWRGRRITYLRLDPEHGAAPGQVQIESVRGE
jgi:hypothetical protein